jgi:hypothetical protein
MKPPCCAANRTRVPLAAGSRGCFLRQLGCGNWRRFVPAIAASLERSGEAMDHGAPTR